MYMYKIVRYLHKPLDSLAILQDLPRVRKPAQLLTALDQHRDEASEHDADLESVCPHYRLHSSLENKIICFELVGSIIKLRNSNGV